MNNIPAEEMFKQSVKSLTQELEGSTKEEAFRLATQVIHFIHAQMGGAGPNPVSTTAGTNTGASLKCPSCGYVMTAILK